MFIISQEVLDLMDGGYVTVKTSISMTLDLCRRFGSSFGMVVGPKYATEQEFYDVKIWCFVQNSREKMQSSQYLFRKLVRRLETL